MQGDVMIDNIIKYLSATCFVGGVVWPKKTSNQMLGNYKN